MLRNPRSGTVAQLGHPLGFVDRVDDVPQCDFLAQRVAADGGERLEQAFSRRAAVTAARIGIKAKTAHVRRTILLARLGWCQ